MKKLIVFVIFILTLLQGFPQSSFEYLYSGPEDCIPGEMIEDSDGNIILPVMCDNECLVIKIGSAGDLIDSVVFHTPGFGKHSLYTPVKLDQSEFIILGGYSTDTANFLWGATFDYDLNQSNDFKVNVDGRLLSTYLYAIKNHKGNIIVATPYEYENPWIHELLIMEITPFGDIINEKYFYITGGGTKLFFNLAQLNNNRYTFLKTGMIQKRNSYVDYVDVDTNFNIKREVELPWSITKQNSIKKLNDSVLITTGQKIYMNNNDFELGLVKTDMDYNLLDTLHFGKSDTMDYPGLHNNMDFIYPGQIYYAGISNMSMMNPYYSTIPSWLMLQKLDEDLNLNWQKFYGGDAYYNLWTVLATEDGGFVMAGTRYDHETQNEERDVYVLKVNENGNVGWSHNGPARVSDFMVYPNPGSNVLHVRSTAQYQRFRFEMYDMSGTRHLMEAVTNNQARINTAHLPAGTYVYRIYDVEGRLAETGKWVK